MTTMTPEQKLKYAIILKACEMMDADPPAEPLTAEQVEEMWVELDEEDYRQDAVAEVRVSGEDTGLQSPSSRHYEAIEVAAKMPDGSWVGWTYWYGGGKHGEPDSIDWMDCAYDLNVVEEEKLMTVRTFTKVA